MSDNDWIHFERDEVWVERLGRFDYQVMRGRERGAPVAEYVGKPHWFSWTAWMHARRLPASYSPRRGGLTRVEALHAIGYPARDTTATGGETT